MPYNYKCPDCGCTLDPGERCECKSENKEEMKNDKGTENQTCEAKKAS
ncbi:MAG: hypothetical protein IJC06_04110 [Clostridia bacterium]|nr:hypothetical protein [Clostridia bacterium]